MLSLRLGGWSRNEEKKKNTLRTFVQSENEVQNAFFEWDLLILSRVRKGQPMRGNQMEAQ